MMICRYSKEESGCCVRSFCGTQRPFEINLHAGQNHDGPVLVEMNRPLRCGAGNPCTMCCCNQEILAKVKGGQNLGRAFIPWYFCTPIIEIQDAQGKKLYEIEKEGFCACVIFDFCKQPFDIKDPEGTKVGKVTKEFDGTLKEIFTDADTFKVVFPTASTQEHRALILAATFLLDINFFETDQQDDGSQ